MATSKVLKPRRGSTAEHNTFKGQAFEITFDTDKKTIVAHDGLTMGGFPLAHEADIDATDSALRALIDQKVSEVEGVSSSELRALESALRGLINNQAQQQVARDADQDNVVTALDSTLRALIAKVQKSAAVSFVVDGSDLVVTYGDGSTERISLPAGKSVGDLWVGIDPNSKPAGVQLYSGQLLSRAAYEAHSALVFGGARIVLTETEWQAYVAEHGHCPWFSEGDGSTTYRFPLVKGAHPKFVAALAEAGQHIKAGAPNITGNAGLSIYGGTTESSNNGAFFDNGYSSTTGAGTGQTLIGSGFDVSRSSSVYRDDIDTIQPEAINMIVGEYVVGSVATPGEADAESLLSSVTTLESNVGAMQSGSGFSAAGRQAIVGWGMPDYSAGVNLSTANNSIYTAPTDGIIVLSESGSNMRVLAWAELLDPSGTQVFSLANDKAYVGGTGSFASILFPIPKGYKAKFRERGSSGSTLFYCFYPLKGARA